MSGAFPFGNNPRTSISAAIRQAKYRRSDSRGTLDGAIQPYVDNAISKTINVREDLDFDSFCALYEETYALGLKGCATFRPNPVTGAVLTARGKAEVQTHCCSMEREPD